MNTNFSDIAEANMRSKLFSTRRTSTAEVFHVVKSGNSTGYYVARDNGRTFIKRDSSTKHFHALGRDTNANSIAVSERVISNGPVEDLTALE